MATLVRGLTNEVHPSILNDFGFVAALREYVAGLREQESFHVTVQAEEVDRQLPAETNLTLFRITQEALRNIRQHAQARNVQIAFVQEHAGVSLMIKDDGRGFNPDQPTQGHFGLLYMRERAEAYGGTFRVVSARGHGTEVWVNFPGRGKAPTHSS
jgi:two-component system sensor histidine kinase DegS